MIKNIEYFFNVKFSITIICFKFSEKYLFTSNEVKKKIKNFLFDGKFRSVFFIPLSMIFLKREVYFVKCFFSFSESQK